MNREGEIRFMLMHKHTGTLTQHGFNASPFNRKCWQQLQPLKATRHRFYFLPGEAAAGGRAGTWWLYSNTCHVYFCPHLPADSPALNTEHAGEHATGERACRMQTRSSRWRRGRSSQVAYYMKSASRGRSHFNTSR